MGCRGRGPRSELERVVLVRGGDGERAVAVVDGGRSLPGRGAWLHLDPQCLELAERRRAFPRALRTGDLDLTAVRDRVEAGTAPRRATQLTDSQTEGELEADGHPMSTQQ